MMEIVCVSASNIRHAGESSTSLRVCILLTAMAARKAGDVHADIIPLADYTLTPCIGCGRCFERDECFNDEAFNGIYQSLSRADALFIVSAHYAPIPAKLSMLLEKVEQLAFLKRFHDEAYRSPLFGKPAGIVGHGGGTGETHCLYMGPVIDSIWNALSYPVEMKVIGVDAAQPRGVTLPVKAVRRDEHSRFPVQEYDWADIKTRLEPLVDKVIGAVV